jgi:hypothetical protein
MVEQTFRGTHFSRRWRRMSARLSQRRTSGGGHKFAADIKATNLPLKAERARARNWLTPPGAGKCPGAAQNIEKAETERFEVGGLS